MDFEGLPDWLALCSWVGSEGVLPTEAGSQSAGSQDSQCYPLCFHQDTGLPTL